jgi:serine phosphatase RsbU (regulator of sigma subunit)/ligand-binding sensor domain-containing protein
MSGPTEGRQSRVGQWRGGLLIGLLCLALCRPAAGHNGHIAMAQPVSGIIVDGVIDDWPSVERFPVEQLLRGATPTDSLDLSAYYRVGYDAQAGALFVGIEVRDSDVVGGGDEGIELYLDALHHRRESPVVLYTIQEDEQRAVDERSYPLPWRGVEVAAKKTPTSRTLEWKISLDEAGMSEIPDGPFSIGFDIVVLDRDGDEEMPTAVAWGKGRRKRSLADRRGDMLIVPDAMPLGTLHATFELHAGEEVEPVWLTSDRFPGLRLSPSLGLGNRLELGLPTAAYRLELEHRSASDGVELQRTIDLLVPDSQQTRTVIHLESLLPSSASTVTETAGHGTRQGAWRGFAIADGLPGMNINAIAQDGDRRLWFGTDDGLASFDGLSFTTVGLGEGPSENRITDVLWDDAERSLWVGTDAGVHRLAAGRWEHYGVQDGLPSNSVLSITQREGNISVETTGGHRLFNAAPYQQMDTLVAGLQGPFTGFHSDHNGGVWFATAERILRHSAGGRAELVLEDDLWDTARFAEDASGRVWLAAGGQLVRFDPDWTGGDKATASYKIPAQVVSLALDAGDRPILSVWGTEGGEFWALEDDEFVRVSMVGGEAIENGSLTSRPDGVWVVANDRLINIDTGTAYDVEDELLELTVNSIYSDADGSMWLATSGGGIIHFDGPSISTVTEQDGLIDDFVYSSAREDGETMWFATPTGVSRYRHGRFTSFTVRDGLQSKAVYEIHVDVFGNVWLQGGRGLTRFDGVRFHDAPAESGVDFEESPAASIHLDRDGNPWLFVDQAVLRYTGRRFGMMPSDNLGKSVAPSVPAVIETGSVTAVLGDSVNGWVGTTNGLYRVEASRVTHHSRADGLADDHISALFEDDEENLWVGTAGGGVSLYDGGQFATFAGGEDVRVVLSDSGGGHWSLTAHGSVLWTDGATETLRVGEELEGKVTAMTLGMQGVWLGTETGEIGRADSGQLRWSQQVANRSIAALHTETASTVWLGTQDGQVCRHAQNETDCDVLADSAIVSLDFDTAGRLWFGSEDGAVGALIEGSWHSVRLTTANEGHSPRGSSVTALEAGDAGVTWIGTRLGGLTRVDDGDSPHEMNCTFITTADGLPSDAVTDIAASGDTLWVSTTGGIARIVDGIVTSFELADGLPHRNVTAIDLDPSGDLWLTTAGGGVARFDGLVFQSLLQRDGLAHDAAHDVHIDSQGQVWFATRRGVTRYSPRQNSPPVVIVNIARTGSIDTTRVTTEDEVDIEFGGVSYRTRPEQITYVYRLLPEQQDWRWTRQTRIDFGALPSGSYEFQVRAVDRDLNYSEIPAAALIEVVPAYGQIAIRAVLALVVLALIAMTGVTVKQRRRVRRAERERMAELERELEKARQMQMALLPAESPSFPGYDIAGRCVPASEVGGDFYHYYPLPGNRLAITLADVTGHAMEAAIPVVMFSGVLENQMESAPSLEVLYRDLNRSMNRVFDKRTFVCFLAGEIDPVTRRLRVANAGCPYPFHYDASTDTVEELVMDGYPIGVRPDTLYKPIETTLDPGDWLVMCSDGIIEAESESGQLFGFEQTQGSIAEGCRQLSSAEGLIEHITHDVKRFAGKRAQGDDQTMIVIRVE